MKAAPASPTDDELAAHAAGHSQPDHGGAHRVEDRLLLEARRRFEVTAFRPGQREVMEAVLAGRDVIGIMPTGAGKSLCYQLPALLLDKATVVVSPLISLMQDQVEKLAQADIDAAKLNSTLTATEERETAREIRRGLHELIYVTPERLENPEAVADLARTGVALVVVDEAHCVSQWGHDFRPAYLSLRDAIRKVGRPPVLALTATATSDVIADVTQQLELRDPVLVNTGIDRPNLFLEVFRTVNEDMKREQLLTIVSAARRGAAGGSGIVYTATVKTADELWQWLAGQGLRVERYHAKRPLGEREETQRRFMAGDLDLIVATKAFGMGIDKPDLRFVVHWQFPDSPESYYQEAGRAGRDGKPARVALLYRLEDRRIQSYFLGGKYPRAEDVRAAYQAMGRLLSEGGRGKAAVTARALSQATGLPERKVKVIVALLEGAGVVERGRGVRKVREFTSLDELATHVESYQRRHRADLDRLRSMMRYAETIGCRSHFLRAYFGEADAPERCGHCDNCCRTEGSLAAVASATEAASRTTPASEPGV